MNRGLTATLTAALVCVALGAAAQEEMPEMTPEQMAEMEAYMQAGSPGEQHEGLAAQVGTYDLEIKSWNEPGGEPMVSTGTATRTMTLEGRVLVETVESSMMGMPFTGHSMTGYDNVSGKYWSTWNDSMSTGIMVSQGTCDEDGSCTYEGSWNDPITGGPVTARYEIQWTNSTTELFEMYGPGKDGSEMKMMEIVYKKQ